MDLFSSFTIHTVSCQFSWLGSGQENYDIDMKKIPHCVYDYIRDLKSKVKCFADVKNLDEIDELTSSCSGANKPIVNRTGIQVCRIVHSRYLLFSSVQTCLAVSTARMCNTIYTHAPYRPQRSERIRERKTAFLRSPHRVTYLCMLILHYNVYLVSDHVQALVLKSVRRHLYPHKVEVRGSFYEQFNVFARSFY